MPSFVGESIIPIPRVTCSNPAPHYARFLTPPTRIHAILDPADVSVLDVVLFSEAEDFSPDAVLDLVAKGCTPHKVRTTLQAIRACRRDVFHPDAAVADAAATGIASLTASLRPYFDLRAAYAAREGAKLASRWH
jgi:hypothetical protein